MINLTPGKFYHVYNRANGFEKMFNEEINYSFFLRKYNYYISPIAETYAYCLLPNHFHFLIQIKDEETIESYLNKEITSYLLSRQFSRLFSCYTQSFNKMYERTGSMFQKNFKRITIENDDYLTNLILYIHTNPIKHKLLKNLIEWKYSSHYDIIKNRKSLIDRKGILNLFDGKKNYDFLHELKLKEFDLTFPKL